MFAKSIVLSDVFLDMPLSARCLYFTLGMLADDDGFVGSPKAIMRQCGASEDDMKLLFQKRYVLGFESGVIVIKHWKINNYLQKDRYRRTTYIEELETLSLDEKGAYTENNKTVCIQNVYTDKNSIDKNSIEGRHKYGEYKHVLLTDEQYNKLLTDLGQKNLEEYIKKVDEYCQQYGKSYKDYNLTIRKWFKNDHKEANDDYSNIITNYDTSNNPKLDLKRFEEIERKRKTK